MKRLFPILLAAVILSGCGSRPTAPLPETTVAVIQAAAAPSEDTAPAETQPAFVLTFATQDREGNAWTQENLSEYKGVVLNFWEPWCGPCVGELPALEKLYQNYKEQGLLVIGVYASEGVEDEVDLVLEDAGVTYPILRYCPDFDLLQTGYVPTTVLLDGEGHLLAQPFSGAMEYEDWAEIAEQMV